MSKMPKISAEQYAKNAKNAQTISTATSIASIGIDLIGNYAAKQDLKKREEFNNNLFLVSEEQKEKFATQIAEANSEEERLKLLGDFFVALSNKRIDKIDNIIQQQEIQKRNSIVMDYVIYGMITIGLILSYVLINKKK